MTSLRITLGAGKARPQGTLVEVPVGADGPVAALAGLLRGLPSDVESWWTPYTFEGDYRSAERWRSACGVATDTDYANDQGDHDLLPADVADEILAGASLGELPGNLLHLTPRGLRVVFLFSRSVTDPALRERAARGAAVLVDRVLARGDLSPNGTPRGLAVDTSALDAARFVYTPSAIVGGVARSADVLVLRREPYEPDALAAEAPFEVPRATPAAGARPERPESDFDRAVAAWNAAHPLDVPASGGECPACGHDECFGRLADDATRWSCFSANHERDSRGCGLAGKAGTPWHGDALDLEAHAARFSRAAVLRRDGFLVDCDPPGGAGTFAPSGADVEASDEPPSIVIGCDMGRVVGEAEAALRDRAPRRVFVRSGRLVVLTREGRPSTKALKRADVLHVHALGTEALRELLATSARIVTVKTTPRGDVEVPTLPPTWVANALAERGEWALPLLVGLVHGPTLRADGSLLATPGYDPASGLFADFDPATFPRIPENPTRDDARAALAALREPFEDFPYVTPADASVDLSAALSLVGRDAIDGPVPLHGLDATTPGSGKGLRADVVSLLGTGRTADVSVQANDPDETRKGLLTVALEGHALVLLDDVDVPFGSNVLAAFLTAIDVSGRRLGVNETAGAPWRAVVLVTANNLAFRGTVGRRALLGTIDPETENPEDRTGFRHDPLREWVRKHRARLYVAALTLLRAFVVAGKPEHGRPRMGSFEAWDRLVRGALLWAGAADPCGTRERVREDADADLDVLRGVLVAWWAAFVDEALTVADVLKRAPSALKDALAALTPRRTKDGDIDPTAVGHALRKVRRRPLGGLRLATAGKTGGVRRYRVERLAKQPTEGGAGDSGDLLPPYAGARAHTHAHGSGGEKPPDPPNPASRTYRELTEDERREALEREVGR